MLCMNTHVRKTPQTYPCSKIKGVCPFPSTSPFVSFPPLSFLPFCPCLHFVSFPHHKSNQCATHPVLSYHTRLVWDLPSPWKMYISTLIHHRVRTNMLNGVCGSLGRAQTHADPLTPNFWGFRTSVTPLGGVFRINRSYTQINKTQTSIALLQ